MKKTNELKNMIKPLIKECLNEILVEEGFKKIMQESVSHQEVKTVSAPISRVAEPVREKINEAKEKLKEFKKQMMDEIGGAGFDPFGGTAPITDKESSGDSGVDISSLLNANGSAWRSTLNAISGKKDRA
jgi:hypothetical protein